MKIKELISAAALVLLTSATFAQTHRGLLATVKYSPDQNRFETWVSHLGDRVSHEHFDAADRPVISQTFYTDYAQITYDDEVSFEKWMATPFEEAIFESAPGMEDWMSQPFETGTSEDELVIEDWMSQPFETGTSEDVLVMEDWMSQPFETGTSEDELVMEDWMSTPFETGEEILGVNWMTASNQ